MPKGTPLPGDRAAWDSSGYPDRHANDIDTITGIHHTLGTGSGQAAAGNHTHAKLRQQAILTFAGELAVGANPLRIYNTTGSAKTILQVHLSVGTAPGGAAVIADVHKDGTTIFTNQAHRPEIAIGAFTGVAATIDVATWADGEYLTAEVDQVGSAAKGGNLVINILFE